MRSLALVLCGTPCFLDFGDPRIQTPDDARRIGGTLCPNTVPCARSQKDGVECAGAIALETAQRLLLRKEALVLAVNEERQRVSALLQDLELWVFRDGFWQRTLGGADIVDDIFYYVWVILDPCLEKDC